MAAMTRHRAPTSTSRACTIPYTHAVLYKNMCMFPLVQIDSKFCAATVVLPVPRQGACHHGDEGGGRGGGEGVRRRGARGEWQRSLCAKVRVGGSELTASISGELPVRIRRGRK
ncbi:unnamed protein product [Urochloa humidicola]